MAKKKPLARIALLMAVCMLLSSCAFLGGSNETQASSGSSLSALQGYDFPDFEPVWGTFSYPGISDDKDSTSEYAYSDKYFSLDSRIYNPSLATMSLCLELSCWSSEAATEWPDKTQNVRALLDELGFEDFAQNEFWAEKPSVDSVGAVAAHKELEDSTLIALAIRGGRYYNEWGGNVTVGAEGEHTGFAEGRDNVVAFLQQYLEDQDITGRVKIWLVGYSRGGAVANLTAGWLNENELVNGAELADGDLFCYAFAPPQGILSEQAGSDLEHTNIHNVINANDLVPMVAPVGWDFVRYNTTSRLIPTVTTAYFAEAKATMLEEYDEILQVYTPEEREELAYNISEYAKKVEFEVDPLAFMPSGDPLLQVRVVDDTRQTQNDMLNRFVNGLIENIGGRDNYYEGLEADLIQLLDRLMGYQTDLNFTEAMGLFVDALTADGFANLRTVLAPTVQLNDTPVSERVDEVVELLYEVVPQPEGYSDLYGTALTLIRALGSMLVNDTEELVDLILSFTTSRVMQAHEPEVMLAWMRAGDPHYTDTPFLMQVPEAVRVVHINFPVDVEVYDSEGTLVADAVDRVCSTYDDAVGCAINKDGEIILHLPADKEYEIRILGDGQASITLSEYNVVHSRVTRVLNYPDIPLSADEPLTLVLPNLTDEEFTDAALTGSGAAYRLLRGEEEIPSQREDRGGDVTYFEVNVSGSNPYGVVTGGGQYLDGSFAQVEAKPVAGSTFEGWYADGTLVSTDPAYSFPVEGSVSLTARFSEVTLSELTFTAAQGGTVANVNHSYSAGSRVTLSATPAEGYVFDRWQTTCGTIEDPTSAQTTLVVGEGGGTVTALFRKTDDAGNKAADCGCVLAAGVSHQAACGKEGHYSCSGEHGAFACGNHYECDGGLGGHIQAACGQAGHFLCSGDHSVFACGRHYICGGTAAADHAGGACLTPVPAPAPVPVPTPAPTPTPAPSEAPSAAPSEVPSAAPSEEPTPVPSESAAPSEEPTPTASATAAACGLADHYENDGRDHTDATTCGTEGHYNCDGKTHTAVTVCGGPKHYACDGLDHTSAACGLDGHYNCDNGDHTACATPGPSEPIPSESSAP
ncbi:MAG: InlB B-repeat-containing protein [Oscillospiraceae bacterium]|nr:InlB B-repeat-containing protein [Oscillospiraceae bacterium]